MSLAYVTPDQSTRLQKIPLWLWPNVLGFDAPLVAVLWQLFLARDVGLRVSWPEPLALFCAAWSVYIADRIFDTRSPLPSAFEPERKQFCRRFGPAMTCAALVISTAGLLLALSDRLSRDLLLYGIVLSCAVLCYLALVHGFRLLPAIAWPREFIVAILFALGTDSPVLARSHSVEKAWVSACLFLLLCWMNLSLIEVEEWRRYHDGRRPNSTANLLDRHSEFILPSLAAAAVALCVSRMISASVCGAVLLACCALYVIAKRRAHMNATVFRVVMDVALCSPLPFLLLRIDL